MKTLGKCSFQTFISLFTTYHSHVKFYVLVDNGWGSKQYLWKNIHITHRLYPPMNNGDLTAIILIHYLGIGYILIAV